jgi:glutamine synthetase
MFNSFQDAAAFIRDHDIQMVDLKFCDLWGRWRHLTFPADQFTLELMRDGVGFDGSSVGLKSVKAGDMVTVPDLSTGFLDPFWEVPTISFIGYTLEADTKKVFFRDPRVVARRADEFMRESGIADESRWGPEFEFYIFDTVAFENEINRAGYRVESAEADWTSGEGGHGYYIPLHGGYHAIPPKDALYNMRSRMSLTMQAMGVPIKYHHHEVGGPGQCEIETPMISGAVQTGDLVMKVKYVTKMVAHAAGMTATFMPKPLFGEAGNGMHFHQHLFKGGHNLFYDPVGYGKLSRDALYFVGGLLLHGPAVLAFTNPSTNSYRRLVPGYEAPVNAFFSLGNRSAAVRIPKYADQPETTRIEFRPPDASGNPYLMIAAQLMAGLDGIRNRIDPTECGFGPIDANIFAWTLEQLRTIRPLPGSLKEALDALDNDNAFLQAGGVFDDEMIADWIEFKLQQEYYAVRNRPHPFEMRLYFDV